MNVDDIVKLEKELDDFDPQKRKKAFLELVGLAKKGEIFLPPFSEEVNVHCHTFFSFNAYGYSPSGFVWRARRKGLAVAGTVDFDVLHGLEETLECGDAIGMRTASGLESRVFIPELKDMEINSPKEPGIYYFMGMALGAPPPEESVAGKLLLRMYELAQDRNKGIMQRVNSYLGRVQIDYESDVISLSPSRNPTERHLVVAYDRKAASDLGSGAAGFWAEALKIPLETITELQNDKPQFHGVIRSKLMKYGSPGYASPDAGSFPTLREAVEMVKEAGGLPTATWLDGTSEGEKNPEKLLDFMLDQGLVINNIIPDRNWNISDPEVKKIKVKNFREYIEACRKRELPVIAGTEMNKYGQPFVDNFNSDELKPFAGDFLKGALILYGHTFAARSGSWTYFSNWADEAFGDASSAGGRKKRNEFYLSLGKAGPYTPGRLEEAKKLGEDITPEKILEALSA